MQNTKHHERFPATPDELYYQDRRLTPKVGILVVILVGAALWARLGGIGITTNIDININISVPAWIMFLGGLALVITVVFFLRYHGNYYFGQLGDSVSSWMHDENRML